MMGKFLFTFSFLLTPYLCYAENYVYVPQDIQKLIAKDETVLSLNYGPLTHFKALDAVVLSMKSVDAERMNYDFKQLYKYPRIIYLLKNQPQWTVIGKNSTILKALDEDLDYITTVDTTFFRADSDQNDKEYPILDLGREGKNHHLNNAIADYKIRFYAKTNKAYIVSENYTYYTPDGEDSCTVSRQYPLGRKEFSTFSDKENSLLQKLIAKQKCGE